jgi:outer membrane biosynthesis protein TonB
MKEPEFVRDLKPTAKGSPPPKPPRKEKVTNDRVRDALVRSLTLHGMLLLAFLGWELKQKYFASPEEEALLRMQQTRSAIRVDMVDLPRLKMQDLNKVDLTIEKTSETATDKALAEAKLEEEKLPPPTPSETAMLDRTKPSDEKKAPTTAKERVKELQERLRADSRRRELMNKLNKADDGQPARPVLGGNVLSQGYSVTGDVATDLDVYIGKVQTHLLNHWRVPGWIKHSSLRAAILVKLAPDGRILSKKFLKKSGNDEFDGYVDRTIDGANPLPAPPAHLKRIALEEGVTCAFPE